ncbi:MAG: hypothetical protein ACREJ2_04655 [Planctomycetota bacterium]
MSYPDDVCEQVRLAKLRQCAEDPRGTGALQLTLGDAVPVTLYAVVRTLGVAQLHALGLSAAADGLTAQIPRQTAADSPSGDSFQGGLLPGDALTFGGAAYRLHHVERDDSDTVFTVIATRDLAVERV